MVDEMICFGDMNVNLLSNNISSGYFEYYNFSHHINDPIRIVSDCMSLLDSILITNTKLVSNSGVKDASSVFDHCLVFTEIQIDCPKRIPETHTYRDFKNIDYNQFCTHLGNAPFHDIYSIDDYEVDFFTGLILSNFNTPINTYQDITNTSASWLTYPIEILIEERDKPLVKFEILKSQTNWVHYKNLRNSTLSSIRREKKAYYDCSFKSEDFKELWNDLKNINNKKNNTDLPNSLQNPEQINNYFASVFIDDDIDYGLLKYYDNNKYPEL
ncbi:hypothetical protein JTB14_014067 [Gonioctena quinquepunctata]|nr:hypothetical protein JTB14_014067 [Gonioctena quinquepunctata]